MAKARIEVDRVAPAAYIDFGVESRGLRADDAELIEANLPRILEFLSGGPAGPAHPAAASVDCFYLVSRPAAG